MSRVRISVSSLHPGRHKDANKTATTLNLETLARERLIRNSVLPTAWIEYTSSSHPAQQTVHTVQQSKCTAVQVLQGSPLLQVGVVVGGSSSRFSSFRNNRNPQSTLLVICLWGWRKDSDVERDQGHYGILVESMPQAPTARCKTVSGFKSICRFFLSKDVKDANNYTSLAPKPK
jgi:hypothetical protein